MRQKGWTVHGRGWSDIEEVKGAYIHDVPTEAGVWLKFSRRGVVTEDTGVHEYENFAEVFNSGGITWHPTTRHVGYLFSVLTSCPSQKVHAAEKRP